MHQELIVSQLSLTSRLQSKRPKNNRNSLNLLIWSLINSFIIIKDRRRASPCSIRAAVPTSLRTKFRMTLTGASAHPRDAHRKDLNKPRKAAKDLLRRNLVRMKRIKSFVKTTVSTMRRWKLLLPWSQKTSHLTSQRSQPRSMRSNYLREKKFLSGLSQQRW